MVLDDGRGDGGKCHSRTSSSSACGPKKEGSALWILTRPNTLGGCTYKSQRADLARTTFILVVLVNMTEDAIVTPEAVNYNVPTPETLSPAKVISSQTLLFVSLLFAVLLAVGALHG